MMTKIVNILTPQQCIEDARDACGELDDVYRNTNMYYVLSL